MNIKAERLGYWYLRLNGFLNITDFVVHPDRGSNQGTDVDILGVRFPYRAENLHRPMPDDDVFSRVRHQAFIVMAEVKASGPCKLNGPWTKPEKQNMLRVLRALGALPPGEDACATDCIYKHGTYANQLYVISMLALGEVENPMISSQYPSVPQITWEEVLRFVHDRFNSYRREKASHGQWDDAGHALWDSAVKHRDVERFIADVRVTG